jgi:hypothetical protein
MHAPPYLTLVTGAAVVIADSIVCFLSVFKDFCASAVSKINSAFIE